MSLTAKPIIKDKIWIVENDGAQVASILTSPEGVTFVYNEKRENFVSIKLLKDKYNITIVKEKKPKKYSQISYDVYTFPCNYKPYNSLLDITKKLPVYTKTAKSKSFYCAGHYLININDIYTYSYCPKLITLNRYKFIGPFYTKPSASQYLKLLKEGNK